MIKYNNSNINDWNFGSDNIAKVYYGVTSGSTSVIPDNFIIPFEDSNVKTLCVNNWGGNVVEGEITYGEAKQVTSLGSVFKGNTTITSFNELVYFTSLSSLNNGEFAGCTNLTDIVIPNNVRNLGYNSASRATFSGCTNLSGVTMISGGDSLTTDLTANNGSYYMNSSHENVPMVFPDREITMSGSTFGYYDYLTIVYFQSSTPPINLANADINNYKKLSTVYCPIGSYDAYYTVLNPKGKTVIEYDFETDSNNVLAKEKEWANKVTSGSTSTVGNIVYQKIEGGSTPPTPPTPTYQTLQELIETHTVTYENHNYTLSPTVSGITYFRLYLQNATTASSYSFSDLNSDTSTSTTKFALKGDSNGSLFTSVDGYNSIKSAANSTSCQWAYWIDENTIEVDVVAAVGTTIFIKMYQENFPTTFISYRFD